MGLTLSKFIKWSCDEKKYKSITACQENDYILEEILDFLNTYSSDKKSFSKTVLMKGFTWASKNYVTKYSNLSIEGYNFREDVHENGIIVFSCKEIDKTKYQITIRSMFIAQKYFKCMQEKAIDELRLCIESNYDYFDNNFGNYFSASDNVESDNSFLKIMSDLLQPNSMSENETSLQIFLDIHNFDLRMSNKLASESSSFSLNERVVQMTFEELQKVCGVSKADSALESIEPIQISLEEKNKKSCIPTWRKLQGDIGYFQIGFHDHKTIQVTASTSGWFKNYGYTKENGVYDYRIDGDVFNNLSDLLKVYSLHFAKHFEDSKLLQDYYSTKQTNASNDDQEIKGSTENDKPVKKEPLKFSTSNQKKKTAKKQGMINFKKINETDLITLARKKFNENLKKKKGECKETISQSDESEIEDEETDEIFDYKSSKKIDKPNNYWIIGKYIKYLKGGNQTSTIITLCALQDMPLHLEECQMAFRDTGGLEVLLNLLDTDEVRCILGSLTILREITPNIQVQKCIVDLNGIEPLINLLNNSNSDIQALAAETISHVTRISRARRACKKYAGVEKLIDLLDCLPKNLSDKKDIHKHVEVARTAALALWSLSKSKFVKRIMRNEDCIRLLGRLLKSSHEGMIIPVVGALHQCSSDPYFRVAIRKSGMIEDLVDNLKRNNPELKANCASTLFKCAQDEETRELIRENNGLRPLISMLDYHEDIKSMAAASGALWKCLISPKNVLAVQEFNLVEKVIHHLNNKPDDLNHYLCFESKSKKMQTLLTEQKVLENFVGVLVRLATTNENRQLIKQYDGITPVVKLLNSSDENLLTNCAAVIGECAKDVELMRRIHSLDGIRLLWSLLKNPKPRVQAAVAWALCPCIENTNNSGEIIRSYVGALELLVSLLKSTDIEVVSAVCGTIAVIAKDRENLAVLTDHGVVKYLSNLVNTENPQLRASLAEAIARCCSWADNRIVFGNLGVIKWLNHYILTDDVNVLRATVMALHELCKHYENCIRINEDKIMYKLLDCLESENKDLQEAAAACVKNIRKLAIINENQKITLKKGVDQQINV